MVFLISLLQNVRLETAALMANRVTLEKEVSKVAVSLIENTLLGIY